MVLNHYILIVFFLLASEQSKQDLLIALSMYVFMYTFFFDTSTLLGGMSKLFLEKLKSLLACDANFFVCVLLSFC